VARTEKTNRSPERRAELAAFLRARRAELRPEDVGLPLATGQRRIPGLRREEVAQISGVGVTWYTWLEQGRDITTRDHVIDALARAFHLDRETHRHLRRLADLPVPEPDQAPPRTTPALDRLLGTLLPAPAYLIGPRFDYLAWNRAYAAVYRDLAEVPEEHRNLIWLMFTDPALRKLLDRWHERAQALLAQFRAAAGQHAGDTCFAELIGALTEASTEFRQWWPRYVVGRFPGGNHVIHHPTAGTIRTDLHQLRFDAHPSITLVAQIPTRAVDHAKLTGLLERPPPPVPGTPPSGKSLPSFR
jgi:MmyB-like transcription regulator ligand binding domain/Helix-turn-helix domain